MTTQIDNYLPYLYTSFEKGYNTMPAINFAKDNYMMPYVLVCLYMLSIFYGKQYMKNREPYQLTNYLATWNATLSIFSLIGALRTTPELLYLLSNQSFNELICTDSTNTWGTGSCGLWVQLFVFSKVPELLDTFFIVARKKKLIFLHWYHHVTVLLYSWNSYAVSSPQTLPFVSINYLVHAMMYGYYGLTAMQIRPAFLKPIYITAAQIIQMVIGTYIQMLSYYNYYNNPTCKIERKNIIAGGIMYLSYFVLFSQFAIKRYHQKNIKKM